MADLTLTAADIVIMMSVATVFPIPQQIQEFATEDVYGVAPIKPGEVAMGVDGNLSGGWTAVPTEIRYMLQANSASISFFEQWYAAEQANRTKYVAKGQIVIPAVGKKFNQVRGFLTDYVPLPPAKKLLQPQEFGITWQSCLPSASGT